MADPVRRIDNALRAVNLGERAHDACGTLSKGLRQRVALARALVNDPEVLPADKMRAVLDTDAEAVTVGDSSCLTHIGGDLAHLDAGVRAVHLAEILAAS